MNHHVVLYKVTGLTVSVFLVGKVWLNQKISPKSSTRVLNGPVEVKSLATGTAKLLMDERNKADSLSKHSGVRRRRPASMMVGDW